MLTLTYEYKLDPTNAQSQAFEQWLEICRKVYNYALRERKDWVNSRKSAVNACSLKQEYILPAKAPRPTFYGQCKSLAAAKETNPELKIPHTHVLQQVLRTLEAAFVAMWERGHGLARFKKRMRSFVYPQLNKVPVKGEMLNLPKIGWVKMRLSRPIPDGFNVKQVRVVKRASGFYAMLALQLNVEVPSPNPSGHGIGIVNHPSIPKYRQILCE
jgi:putative transposase